jgi:hypothetical protein
MQNTQESREAFFAQYIETLLWSETDDNGESLDGAYSAEDVDAAGLAEMRQDCDDFVSSNLEDLADIEAGQAGHDFALTRNGHGAGFWDRGLGELGDRLSDAAKVYGTQGLSVGNDGVLYVHG